uniref:sensor histidine kinase n=1 Tax=Flavobacterium sp. TaxID=239 RepID=UPI004049014A
KAQIDEVQLTQVLFNIIMNAIYVSPIESKITILIYTKKENVVIEIKDEGTGIEDKIKSKIFEPFFTTKEIGIGSGLGLSVVHGIIKSHRGEIKVKNNKPKGTNFQIILPLKEK